MKFSLVLLALCLACTNAQVIGESTAAIAGGTVSDNDSIVFVATSSGTTCSAAVIGPRHVLIAKHCLYNGDVLARPSEVMVITGPTVRGPTGTFQGENIVATPGAPAIEPSTNDLAVIITTDDIGAPTLAIATVAPALDDPLTIVGYGQTEAGASGVRREVTTPVTGLMGTLITAGNDTAGACSSDGPALTQEGALVAMAIFFTVGPGGAGACPPESSSFRDVTQYRDFIDDALTTVPDDAGIGGMDAGADASVTNDAGVAGDTNASPDGGNDAGPVASGGGCAVGASGALGAHAWLLMMGIWRRRRSSTRSA